MKKTIVLFCLLLPFLAQAAALILFAENSQAVPQDTIAVNDILKTIEARWNVQEIPAAQGSPMPDFAVLDKDGQLLWKTADFVSESIHAAIQHRDTILDICPNGETAGKLIVFRRLCWPFLFSILSGLLSGRFRN